MGDGELLWQPLLLSDVDDVNAIACSIHPDLPERPEVFAEKLRLFPQGCRKLVGGRRIAGYGISHPWVLRAVPPLDKFLHCLPDRPQCLFIHDVAVLPDARGKGAAAEFVLYVKGIARSRSIPSVALVSVYDTDALWKGLGFHVVQDPELETKLASYGPAAKYMMWQGR